MAEYDGVIHEKHAVLGRPYTHYYDAKGPRPLKTLCGIHLEFPNPSSPDGYTWAVQWIPGQIDPDIRPEGQVPSCNSCKKAFMKLKGIDTRAYCGICHKKYMDVELHLFKAHGIATKEFQVDLILKKLGR